MGKGQKQCDKCLTLTGPRAFCCPSCKTPFIFKVKSKETKTTKILRNIDWKTLVCGDRIKVNGGPYYIGKDGDYIPMGYRGKFRVEKVEFNGIHAYGIDKHTGYAFIWMGKDMKDKETNVNRTAHKIIKFKLKENGGE